MKQLKLFYDWFVRDPHIFRNKAIVKLHKKEGYGSRNRSCCLSDHLISSVEITKSKQDHSSDADVKNGSANDIRSLICKPLITSDTASWIKRTLLFAVGSAYFRTEKTFMKLRLNITYQIIYNTNKITCMKANFPTNTLLVDFDIKYGLIIKILPCE